MAKAREIKPGKWRLDAYMNGYQKTITGTSKKDVQDKERKWKNEIDSYGKTVKGGKKTLERATIDHLLTNVKKSVEMGTFERYMSIYNTHIRNSKIGKKDVKNIEQEDIQELINKKSELSKSSLNLLKIVLDGTFNYCIDNNYIRKNPVKNIRLPKKDKKHEDIDVLSTEEQKLYMSKVNESAYALMFKTALTTGMRAGELSALKWENVDFTNNIIKVTSSARRVTQYDEKGNPIKKSIVTGNAKTISSYRDIPLTSDISVELKKMKLSRGAKKYDFVFVNKFGLQVTHDSISKAHKLVCQKAGIRFVNFHVLRHTFATRSIEAGVPIKTVSDLLGHSKIQITLDKYVHTTNAAKVEAIEKLNKLISSL